MAVFYRALTRFTVEVLKNFRPNDISFHLEIWGRRRWYIVVCYLTLDDAPTIECVVPAIGKRPNRETLLVVRNFNAYFTFPEGSDMDKDITAALAAADLEDMSEHFLMCL